ncbi:flagellar cap protein FliD [Pseudomonas sp. RW407]|uniref:flagellar filament capping protein FliD n=1 Tax=Pseudomonas sp. RW407 TaxID=2202894 RepID=UPI000D6FA57D|nr:flagellar filament capping protein FliD [Pseudomonas sp. RW407]PWU30176.1 flagellar cap protein FliD [Pseudomonas sp. RW407]
MTTISSSSSGSIASTGLGSGLDIDSIVSALVKAQTSAKQTQITNLTKSSTTQLSAVGSLKSALSTFQLAVATLNTADSFSGLKATSSDDTKATATASASATAGTYTLEVDKLATASKVASQYVGSSDKFGAGRLTLSQGSSNYYVTVSAGDSLSTIRDNINKLSSTSGISANIVTDSSGSRLVLSSTTTGAGTDISVKASGDSTLGKLAIDGSAAYSSSTGGYLVQAGDAEFKLDGLSMTSSSNTLDKAVSGVTFNLLATGSSTVTVATNTDDLTANIQKFVDAYNTMIKSISSLTDITTTTNEDGTTSTSAGPLSSDATTRTLLNSLRNEFVNLSSSSGTLQVLSQLGITSQKDGTLSVDSSKLSKGLETYSGNIQSFFTGSDGFLKRMYNAVDSYAKTNGILDQQTDSINSTISSLKKQQTDLDDRTAKLTDILYAKYNAMDSLVAQLNATSSSVMTTLNALNKSSDD